MLQKLSRINESITKVYELIVEAPRVTSIV